MEGASIETVEVLDEFKPEPAVGGSIVLGGFRMDLPTLGGGRRTIGYRYRESILPVDASVLVVGAVSDSTGEVRLCRSADGEKKLLVTTKAYDALVAGAKRTARILRYVTITFIGAGFVIAVLGVMR